MTLRPQPRQRLVRPPLPDGLLMARPPRAVTATAPPRFEPALMRRKRNGTHLLRRLPARDRDPHPRAHRPAPQRPRRRPAVARPGLHHRHAVAPADPGRDPARARRLDPARHDRRGDHLPDRDRRRRLPRRVRARQSLHPAAPDEHQQPGRRAVDHLRHLRAGHLRPAARASGPSSSRGRRRWRWSSCRSSSSPASRRSRPSRRRSAKAPTRSAPAAGRWSAARSCRRRRPGS